MFFVSSNRIINIEGACWGLGVNPQKSIEVSASVVRHIRNSPDDWARTRGGGQCKFILALSSGISGCWGDRRKFILVLSYCLVVKSGVILERTNTSVSISQCLKIR